jgi:hypothetical protein
MNVISGAGALVARMRELANAQPSPSIADVVGNPDTPGPDFPDPSEFTAKYEMAALANAFRANADQALTLIEMFDPRRTDRG